MLEHMSMIVSIEAPPAAVVVPHALLVVRHRAAKEAEIVRRLTSATI